MKVGEGADHPWLVLEHDTALSLGGLEVAMAGCFEPGHRVTGILSVIGHALHDALHVLCRMRLLFTR